MDLTTTSRLHRWRWLLAGALAIAAVGGVVGYAAAQPEPQPTARVYVSFSPLPASTKYQGQVAESFAAVAKTPIVLRPVIAELGLHLTPNQLAERVTSSSEKDRTLIDISVTGDSQADSARVANAVGRQLIAVSSSLGPDHSGTTVKLTLVELAHPS